MGARGKGQVGGVLLGSVSKEVLRRARTSVLIMRHKIVEGLTGKTYEMFCPMILSRILCPVDFSRYSDHAVALLGMTPGVREVILLHVVARGENQGEIQDAVRAAGARLDEARAGLAAQGIGARVMVRTGSPAVEIAAAADGEDVSVIWMSSHGRGWFRELLIGSTAFSVAMNAPRPVMVIRTPEDISLTGQKPGEDFIRA
jgi:nucleotide-binding universal stress UspA family protein